MRAARSLLSTSPQLLRTRLGRDIGWIGGGQVLAVAGRLAGVRILTGLLTPVQFGTVVLLLGAAALGASIFCQPVQQAALRFYPDAQAAGMEGALRRWVRGRLTRSLAWLGGAAAAGWAAAWWTGWEHLPSGAAVAALWLLLAVDVHRTFESNLLNARRQQRAFAGWGAADAWVRAGGGFAGAVALPDPVAGVLLGQAVGAAAVLLGFVGRPIHRPGDAGPTVDAWTARFGTAIRDFTRPLVPHAVLGWVIGLSDRYLLAALAGTAAAGLYGAAYGLASQPFMALTGILLMSFRPLLFQAASDQDRGRERTLAVAWLGLLLAVGGVGVLALVTLSDWIVGLALGPDFRSGSYLLGWIGAAYLLQSVGVVFDTLLLAHHRTRGLLVVQIVGAITAVLGYLLFIPRLGALGAAYGTILSFACSVATGASLVLVALRRAGARMARP